MPAKEEHSPAYKIWHYEFHCRVPAMHTVSQEEADVRGFTTTGDAQKDSLLAQEPVDISATIRQMVEYHREGVEVVLANPQDSQAIYQNIKDFLVDYDQKLDHSFNLQPGDRELFKAMDSFATEVFKIARRYIEEPGRQSGIMGALDRLGTRAPVRRGPEQEQQPQVKVQKEHQPLSDSISRKAMNRSRPWK